MGGFFSTPTPENPAFFEEPWRKIKWGYKQTDLKHMRNFKPSNQCRKIRILVVGPAGAGKSSFINSVQTALRGRVYTMALVDSISQIDRIFTKKYSTYEIPKGPRSVYLFVFSDTMGLEDTKGVLVDDINMALKGHMKDGYRFNPESRLTEDDQYYNKSPGLSDKVHVLVYVVPANTASSMREETVRKIREIREEASELGIPQVVLLTKIDLAYPEVTGDLKNVYKVKSIKQEMEELSEEVGVPMNCIFPVRNYSEENALNDDVDSLILNALTNIIDLGEDFIRLTTS